MATQKLTSPLIRPEKVGELQLSHRVVMSGMTRMRGDPIHWAPTELMAKYYAQRASSGGLIITESSAVNPEARCFPRGPNMYDDYHLAGWKSVVHNVHARGGFIFGQLFHAGRVAHPRFMPDWAEGGHVVGASDLPAKGDLYTAHGIKEPYGVPRALSTEEVAAVVQDFAKAAKAAVEEAGFDGVEIYAGNGYLIQQFMAAKTNSRTDKYGGNLHNRMRFLLEVVDAVAAEVGPQRVGLKLMPGVTFSDLIEPLKDVHEQLKYLAPELSKRQLAYVCVASLNDEPYSLAAGLPKPNAHSRKDIWEPFREKFAGVHMINGGLTIEIGAELVKAGVADLVAYSVPFIANANLPQLVAAGYGSQDLNPGGLDKRTWYGEDPAKDAVGFTEWPLIIPMTRSRDN